MQQSTSAGAVPDHVYLSAYRFFSNEADLLDRRAYGEWLSLLTDDIRYRVTAQLNQDAASGARDYAIIDEDAFALRARVEQIASPKLTHAENPPTLARRFFSGLSVSHGNQGNELFARTSLMIFRTKHDLTEGGLYVGLREDCLREVAGQWKLARRDVRLDHSVLYGCVSVVF